MREGTGRSVYNQLPSSLNLAGKTGTSNDSRDSWFAGFSQDLLAVVWLGRDDNGPTPLTGATGALQVWTSFMRKAGPTATGHADAGQRHPGLGGSSDWSGFGFGLPECGTDALYSRQRTCPGLRVRYPGAG